MTLNDIKTGVKFRTNVGKYRKLSADYGKTHGCHDLSNQKYVQLLKDTEVTIITEVEES